MHPEAYQETIPVPRAALRFPLQLPKPDGFVARRQNTWPLVEGRLEYVGGRLLYMPPCGDDQQDVAIGVAGTLFAWVRRHADFVVGANEAGVMFGKDVRGADAAIWRRSSLGPNTGGFRRVPPVLAVEVAGQDEGEALLLKKARWYLTRKVSVVWLVFPTTREVVVLKRGVARRLRFRKGDRLPEHAELPDLRPLTDDFFFQLGRE